MIEIEEFYNYWLRKNGKTRMNKYDSMAFAESWHDYKIKQKEHCTDPLMNDTIKIQ